MAMIKTVKKGWVAKVTHGVTTLENGNTYYAYPGEYKAGTYEVSTGYLGTGWSLITDDVQRARSYATAAAAKAAVKNRFNNRFGETAANKVLLSYEAEYISGE